MIQQVNQFDIEIQNAIIPPERTQMTPSTSKKVTPQQFSRSEFSIPILIFIHVITKRQKWAFITDGNRFPENLL